ncbi:hypothetical protein GCM10018966_000300 [Streptomyces yanii]
MTSTAPANSRLSAHPQAQRRALTERLGQIAAAAPGEGSTVAKNARKAVELAEVVESLVLRVAEGDEGEEDGRVVLRGAAV